VRVAEFFQSRLDIERLRFVDRSELLDLRFQMCSEFSLNDFSNALVKNTAQIDAFRAAGIHLTLAGQQPV